ncbi:hypothetical protein MMC30_005879 [Trapelia coarctata]|nr:hypothetical protein [Trapelia coarctata]
MLLSTVFVAALPLLVTAAPTNDYGDACKRPTTTTTTTTTTTASSTAAPTNTPFTVISARSGSPVHLIPMEAYNRNITLGLGPSSYCPNPNLHCPPGTTTTFIVNDDVDVPGGQLLYVTARGALSYTAPHSGAIPPGAVSTGFVYEPGPSYGHFSFSGLGATGFLACPVAGAGTYGPFQVFAGIPDLGDADVPNHNVSQCLGFSALASPAAGPGAWEYTR